MIPENAPLQNYFDVEFYERLLDQQPNDVRLLRLLGELHARKGRHALALQLDQRLVELAPSDPVVYYNLACSLAMLGDAKGALATLSRALELGYNDFSHLDVDPELDTLRHLPEYKTLLQNYGLDA
jgi:predicted Zn-dependent protease